MSFEAENIGRTFQPACIDKLEDCFFTQTFDIERRPTDKMAQALESLRAPLFEDKVCDFIFGRAQVTEQPVTVEELMRDPDEDSEANASAAAVVGAAIEAETADADATKPVA